MYDVVVIGSGPGGYVAAIRAAQLGLKTACIEKSALGGTCLNVGCIPSKALLHSSELYYSLGHSMKEHGIAASGSFDFTAMMERKKKVIKDFNGGVAYLFKKNKIDHIKGMGTLKGKTTILVTSPEGEKTIEAKNIIIATGSEPSSLPIFAIDETKIVTSTGALELKEVPKRLIVVGAGVIGVELGSVFSRLGSQVTFVEFLDQVCPTLDKDVATEFQKALTAQGMTFHLSTKVESATVTASGVKITTSSVACAELEGDVVLVSVGRRPYTKGLGLENVGITLDKMGRISVNSSFQTAAANIYAIGDVIDGPMLAHKASEEGVAVAEILAGHAAEVDYVTVPNVVYTHPEVATVGLSEKEAREKGIELMIGKFPFMANSRAKCVSETTGFVKVLGDKATGKLIGVQIIGAHASELISSAGVAIKNRMTVQALGQLPFAHPTLSEAFKESALATLSRALHI